MPAKASRAISSPSAFLLGLSAMLAVPLQAVGQQGVAAETFVLINATLIDGTGTQPRPGTTITVRDGLITAVSPAEGPSPAAGVHRIDLAGRFVVPGLIDAHVHLSNNPDPSGALETLLHNGVTAVRDMGGDARTLAVLARDSQIGQIQGPSIFFSALLYGPDFLQDPRSRFSQRGMEPGTAPWSRVVTESADVTQVVAEARGTGATGLKLYSAVHPALLKAIVKEAHRQDLEVWSHSSIYPSRPSDAVRAGVDVLSHAAGLYPEAFEQIPSSYTEAITNWFPVQDFGKDADGTPAFADLFGEMARNGTILEPTLSPGPTPPGQGREGQQAHLARAAAQIDMEARNAWACDATRAAYRMGVRIAAGTDSNGSDDVRREIQALVRCGLDPLAAIASATTHAAAAIGIDATHGSIVAGMAADLLILDADPSLDVANLYRIDRVMKAGRWVER